VVGMKVKYIGKELVAIEKGKIYNVISVEKGWFRIMTELDEDYLFPPELFEVIEN
jgi:tRNA A22 N-methylase